LTEETKERVAWKQGTSEK